MPIQKTITLYTFDELPTEKAKENARDWWRRASMNDTWYESIYEDATQTGLKINAFDTYRGDECDIEFTAGAYNAADLIIKNHGEECDTYKAAKAYQEAVKALPNDSMPQEEFEQLEEKAAAIEKEFLYNLSRAYLKMLREELEYIDSDEHIDETIITNEYTFREDGKREDV